MFHSSSIRFRKKTELHYCALIITKTCGFKGKVQWVREMSGCTVFVPATIEKV